MNRMDVEQLDSLLSALYEATLDNSQWADPLEQLRALFSANYVTLILKMPDTQDEDDLGLMVSVGDMKDSGEVVYFPYRHNLTPFVNQPPDKVFTEEDLMTSEEWHDSPYRVHWCAPNDVYHVMAVDISTPDSGTLRFRVTRGEASPPFTADDKELCAFLLPHLRRALNIRNLLDRSQTLGSLYSKAISRLSIATVLIDENGQVLDQNVFAREILESGDGLKLVGGRLEASYPSDNRDLRRLIKEAFESKPGENGHKLPEAMSITRPSGEVSLGVVIESIPSTAWAEGKGQPAAVVYIRDAVGKSQASNEVAKKLFGLTPAETALSIQLANGLSLEEAAEALNIRRNTARAHLRAIFSKTGVRRQTELVRIFLNSVAALGQGDQED
ncbi:helix-turn-helix transcriptional regulator [Marinobacterium sediminicola]|uniref:DNA-binding transcriptional regulator, CsgD family n=1 Tax=Marinobacterium sediminicola TaxID=518898 RepID=A0ABY1S4K4_9GAMM|nr:helix-turn-helix transcriptional regulator [Marinobacterium sediminicola]ULG70162.1 helix-turn-helix transcriptional regulator [Marinobacterium sediminicola]SMR78368.1 DNA-binding transcriptional regulator, CsgD family [Marinobacterium sediminicola]